MDPATPRKTFNACHRHVEESPTKKRRQTTPSRRKMFMHVFSETKNTGESVNTFNDRLKESGTAFKNIGDKSLLSQEHLISGLICNYGVSTTSRLIGAVRHVPANFPNRTTYIYRIVNVGEGKEQLTETEISQYSALVQDVEEFQLSDELLWKCTLEYKEGYNLFLVPPINECVQCSGTLYYENKCEITIFTLSGPVPGQKVTMRCKKGCGTTYNIDKFNAPTLGTHFYGTPSPYIGASNKIFVTRAVHELICESANHAFVSHHAFTEIYNSLFERSTHSTRFREWVNSLSTDDINDEDGCEVMQVNDNGESNTISEKNSSAGRYTLSRKKTSNAYFNGELANEVQERSSMADLKIDKGESREHVMRKIDKLRRQELYPHYSCPSACQEKGCKTLRVIDGCWKVCLPHCMYAVEMEVAGMPLLNFPNVCTSEPKANSVFCDKHHQLLQDNGIPTNKQDFLKYIGCKEHPSSADDVKDVDRKTVELSRTLSTQPMPSVTAADYQGTSDMAASIKPDRWHNDNKNDKTCNKDTGEKSRLRQRSRGHFICVTGGGHIQYFEPIFKSESPGQVFLIVLRVMHLQLSSVPAEKLDEAMENFVLSYDNMCQLDSLRAAKEPLPFPKPFDLMWQKIVKIIDRLHIVNHVNPRCHTDYNPNKVPETHNTMIAEQTFAWFSRFKKVVNSMTQTHHLFYVHRNIKRRNLYTEKCRNAGKEPQYSPQQMALYSYQISL